jgi:hypothetical protein
MFPSSKREIVVRRVIIKKNQDVTNKPGEEFNRRELIDTIILFRNANEVRIIY